MLYMSTYKAKNNNVRPCRQETNALNVRNPVEAGALLKRYVSDLSLPGFTVTYSRGIAPHSIFFRYQRTVSVLYLICLNVTTNSSNLQ